MLTYDVVAGGHDEAERLPRGGGHHEGDETPKPCSGANPSPSLYELDNIAQKLMPHNAHWVIPSGYCAWCNALVKQRIS